METIRLRSQDSYVFQIEEYYRKPEADAVIERLEAENAALRERLARLVEAAKRFYEAGWTQRGFEDCLQKLEMAIAEAEK